ncbi:MAG: DotU family type VI secretion system protein, partial [Azoarcus sp.]|nr:DotU family type VI secretion system protein [Azoarcus sp.]
DTNQAEAAAPGQAGAGASGAPAPAPAQRRVSVPAQDRYNSASGVNPLVWAANRLLNMLPQIRATHRVGDLSALRAQLAAEVTNFEQRAQSVGVPHDEIIGARYCLCTVLDEAAAQTPWGGQGKWNQQSLLVSFHNEAWGGEKYYTLLARLAQNPERHKNLIELLYYCNALGFGGRFRIGDGSWQLEILKKRIATILGNVRGGYENRLSPHWQGVSSTPPTWRMVPPWVAAMLCGLIGFGIYLYFLFNLGNASDAVYGKLAALKVPEPVAQRIPEPPPLPAPGLCDFMGSERLVTVENRTGYCVVTLLGDGLFESGSVDVRAHYLSVLERIGKALRKVSGNVIVSGYTDNVPIRSLRFPSNWELSQARAEAVKDILDNHLGRTARIRAEGRGEADPVADNGTREGRAKNRRVEIAILLPSQTINRQRNPSETAQ